MAETPAPPTTLEFEVTTPKATFILDLIGLKIREASFIERVADSTIDEIIQAYLGERGIPVDACAALAAVAMCRIKRDLALDAAYDEAQDWPVAKLGIQFVDDKAAAEAGPTEPDATASEDPAPPKRTRAAKPKPSGA